MLDVAHGWLASANFMVGVDLVLCFSTLHISVWSAGEISTWYQWANWFVEKIIHYTVHFHPILVNWEQKKLHP